MHLKTCLLTLYTFAVSFTDAQQNTPMRNPLAVYNAEWNLPVYRKCNTAIHATYMTAKEREVIYIINLVRQYPKKFATLVVDQYIKQKGKEYVFDMPQYYQTLVDTLMHMNPMPLLQPDKKCFESALCHATSSGQAGYVGHNRLSTNCEKSLYYNAESCDYGYNDPLDIVMALLIDDDVPSLGHRLMLIGGYSTMGVSIQPHKGYRYNAVLDAKF